MALNEDDKIESVPLTSLKDTDDLEDSLSTSPSPAPSSGSSLPAPVSSAASKPKSKILLPAPVIVPIWMAFSVSVILYNKYLYSNLKFEFPVFLVTWHLIFATIGTRVLQRTTNLLDGTKDINLTKDMFVRSILPIGLLFSGSLILSNSAYLHLSVSYIQMLKAFNAVAVLLISWAFRLSEPNRKLALIVSTISFGVALTSTNELRFNLLGFIIQAFAVIFEAARLVMIEILLHGLKMDPLVSLHYYAPVCAMINLVFLPFTEGLAPFYELARLGPLILLSNACVAFFLNVAAVFLVGATSGLVLTLAGVLKDIMLITGSVLLFGAEVAPLQVFGYAIALGGLVLFKTTGGKYDSETTLECSPPRTEIWIYLRRLQIRCAFVGNGAPKFSYNPTANEYSGIHNSDRKLENAQGTSKDCWACNYGWYDDWRNLYPADVRIPLKRGITAKNSGDRAESVYWKRQAWDTARRLPIQSFTTTGDLTPYLKITGIAVDLAGELEDGGEAEARQAYEVYGEALEFLKSASELGALSGPERMRGVGIAVKLGGLAEALALPRDEEERARVWAVEEVLRLLTSLQQPQQPSTQSNTNLQALLPQWMSKNDVVVPLQELGDFYARVGRVEYAMPLYLQGASMLVSDAAGPPEEMCQGAHLMNNIAELVIRRDPSEERRRYAEEWAQKALGVLQSARRNANSGKKERIPTCEQALAAALFNAGVLREMAGDEKRARAFFTSAIAQSKSAGLQEGVDAARDALARLPATENEK